MIGISHIPVGIVTTMSDKIIWQKHQAVYSCNYNAGQNNLAKTSSCVFLNRKGDFSELPLPQFQCCS